MPDEWAGLVAYWQASTDGLLGDTLNTVAMQFRLRNILKDLERRPSSSRKKTISATEQTVKRRTLADGPDGYFSVDLPGTEELASDPLRA